MTSLRARHLNSDRLEEPWVPERKLHHLFDLSELLPTASDIVIPDIVQILLFILPQKAEKPRTL